MAPEFVNKKGVTLIIVVFAMMLLGVLGWTLARMQATDFESNLRTFEPENALNLAEAGAQWALNRLSADSRCRSQSGLLRCPPLASPVIDTDCNDSGDWLSAPHSLIPGQYNLCLRDSCVTCSPAENGNVVIVSRGYIPSQSGSRTMRQIKLEVDIGSLTNAVQTQAADPDDISAGLFNWSSANNFPPAAPIHNPTRIEGAISAGHYEGDNDATTDELGQDYDPPPAPILPDDNNNPENDIRDFATSYPVIDMNYFNAAATNRWPPIGRNITAIADNNSNTDRLIVSTDGFFTGMANQAVRNTSQGGWIDSDWAVIVSTANIGPCDDCRANLDRNIDNSWDGDNIKLVRRFYQNAALQRWYIGRQISGGETADALIDLSSNNIDLTQTSIVSEGDIVINGGRRLRMRFFGGPLLTRYPNLATQNGNILSTDQPNGGNENSRRDQRQFNGLIYSQNGEVNFNYLDGRLVYGKQVTLDGTTRIRYTNGRITSGGFVFEPSTLIWKEE